MPRVRVPGTEPAAPGAHLFGVAGLFPDYEGFHQSSAISHQSFCPSKRPVPAARSDSPMSSEPTADSPGPNSLASLRRFVRKRADRERCELCDADLADDHSHMVEVSSRRLVCACDACAILFSHQGGAKYRRVPRRVRFLDDFRLSDETWEGLQLPIDLAFFLRSTPA